VLCLCLAACSWCAHDGTRCCWQDGYKFNRGKLLNVGAWLAFKAGFEAVCFHDVDLLPSVRCMKLAREPSAAFS
jgi:hypothetical protein